MLVQKLDLAREFAAPTDRRDTINQEVQREAT
jgi:hypothetical protein